DPPRIDWRSDLAGHMATTINLGTITLLLGLDDHRMTGQMRLEATLAGTLKSPKLTGAGHIRGGSYENLSAGTRLTGLTADIAATRDEITLSSLSARTARNGSVSGKGAVSLKDVTDPVFNFTLALDKAQVMQLQNMEARVSGALQGAGRADGMELSGDLKIDGAEVYLAGFGSGSASSMLNIKEVNVPPRLRRQRGLERPAAPPYRIGLDVRVRAPGRIFVRAQGLESEWGADLRVTGSAAAPALDGYLKLIR